MEKLKNFKLTQVDIFRLKEKVMMLCSSPLPEWMLNGTEPSKTVKEVKDEEPVDVLVKSNVVQRVSSRSKRCKRKIRQRSSTKTQLGEEASGNVLSSNSSVGSAESAER